MGATTERPRARRFTEEADSTPGGATGPGPVQAPWLQPGLPEFRCLSNLPWRRRESWTQTALPQELTDAALDASIADVQTPAELEPVARGVNDGAGRTHATGRVDRAPGLCRGAGAARGCGECAQWHDAQDGADGAGRAPAGTPRDRAGSFAPQLVPRGSAIECVKDLRGKAMISCGTADANAHPVDAMHRIKALPGGGQELRGAGAAGPRAPADQPAADNGVPRRRAGGGEGVGDAVTSAATPPRSAATARHCSRTAVS